MQATQELTRNAVIARIRQALKVRSGKPWSVTGGRGTAWGWINISAPPRRLTDFHYMTDADRAELGRLLGLDAPAHPQGVSIPASSAYYRRYLELAETGNSSTVATPYWD